MTRIQVPGNMNQKTKSFRARARISGGSLRYCTLVIREGEDDLGKFKGASHSVIGNDIRFDLRVYRGHIHTEVTVTLYSRMRCVDDERRSKKPIDRAIKEMGNPNISHRMAARAGFQFGKLQASVGKTGLLKAEARILIPQDSRQPAEAVRYH